VNSPHRKRDRQRTYNTVASSCNYCCSGKAMSITYSQCAFVALGTQCEMHMRHTVNCGYSGSTIFFNIFSQTAGFPFKKLHKIKRMFWFFPQNLSETFRMRRTERDMIKMYIVLKCPLLLSDFNENWILPRDFRKKLKLHENRSSGSRVFPCIKAAMTKLIVTLCSFSNAPKNIP
jgi:hypothetical protein